MWKSLHEDIEKRLNKPKNHPTFIIYFTFILMVGGGIGVWLPPCLLLLRGQIPDAGDYYSIATNLSTYLIAIISASLADSLLIEQTKPFRLVVFSLSLLCVTNAVLVLFTKFALSAMLIAAPATILSLIVWWLVNANEGKLEEKPVPASATVGNTPSSVQLPGSMQGYS